jgi:integrase
VCVLGASGARNTEVCLLTPADLDFVHGKIRVGRSKTRCGVREIDMTPWLQRELEAYVAWLGDDYPSDAPLIPTCLGTFYNKDSLNRRLKAVHREATEMCLERRLPSLPTRLTCHVFRRTYITLMLEGEASPPYVQQQVGHEDANTTLTIYARVMRNRDRRSFGRAFDELMTGAVPESPFKRGGEGQAHLRAA